MVMNSTITLARECRYVEDGHQANQFHDTFLSQTNRCRRMVFKNDEHPSVIVEKCNLHSSATHSSDYLPLQRTVEETPGSTVNGTHRKDATYPAIIVSVPPMVDFYIGGASLKLSPIFNLPDPSLRPLTQTLSSRPSPVRIFQTVGYGGGKSRQR